MFAYYLKLALLSLKKTPILSFLMVLAIAVGIGLTMTTLTVYHMMSANPVEHKNTKLFALQLQTKDESSDGDLPAQLTYMDAMAMRQSDIPVRQTAMYVTGFSVGVAEREAAPFFEQARLTDSDFFTMFEARFIYGAAWEKSVDEVGVNVAVINETLNNKLFGGENSVGKTLLLDSKPYTIQGVIKDLNPSPKYYDLNNGSFDVGEAVLLPFSLASINHYTTWGNTNGWKAEMVNTFDERMASELMWLQHWVEFDNIQQKEQFQVFLDSYIAQQKQYGRFSRNDAAGHLKNVQQWLDFNGVVGDDNRVLVGLGFLFLVVCLVNTVGLLLAKFLRRSSEIGVRRALGASQWAIFQQHLIEVGLLGMFGGLLGLVMSFIGLSVVRTLYGSYERLTSMDVTMVSATIAIAVLSSVLAGMFPAWRICRTNPAVHLKTQ